MNEPIVELNNNLYTQFARAQAFLPNQVRGMFVILKFLLEEFLVFFGRPVELFLRVRFGARGHSAYQATQIAFFGVIIGGWAAKFDLLLGSFCILAAGLSVYHLWEARRQDRLGPPTRYSWSSGEPFDCWRRLGIFLGRFRIKTDRFLTVENISRFGEPALVCIVQLIVWRFSRPLGIYLCCCSVALFVKSLIVHERLRTMRFDQQDARILSSWLASQSRGAGAGDQTAFVVRLAARAPAPLPPDPVPVGNPIGRDEQFAPTAEPKVSDPLSILCDNCGRKLRVSRKHIGKTGRCKCGHDVPVTADTAQ